MPQDEEGCGQHVCEDSVQWFVVGGCGFCGL